MRVYDEHAAASQIRGAARLPRDTEVHRSRPLPALRVQRGHRPQPVVGLQLGLGSPQRNEQAAIPQSGRDPVGVRTALCGAAGDDDSIGPGVTSIRREEPVCVQIKGSGIFVRLPGLKGLEPPAVGQLDDSAGCHRDMTCVKVLGHRGDHGLGPGLAAVLRAKVAVLEGQQPLGLGVEHQLGFVVGHARDPQDDGSVAQSRQIGVEVVVVLGIAGAVPNRSLAVPDLAITRPEHLQHSIRRVQGLAIAQKAEQLAIQRQDVGIDGIDDAMPGQRISEDHTTVDELQSGHAMRLRCKRSAAKRGEETSAMLVRLQGRRHDPSGDCAGRRHTWLERYTRSPIPGVVPAPDCAVPCAVTGPPPSARQR